MDERYDQYAEREECECDRKEFREEGESLLEHEKEDYDASRV